jgi:hypothetical protein
LFIRNTPFGAVHGTNESLVCAAAAMLEQIPAEKLDQTSGLQATIDGLHAAAMLDY